jgi:hypothetical protein
LGKALSRAGLQVSGTALTGRVNGSALVTATDAQFAPLVIRVQGTPTTA